MTRPAVDRFVSPELADAVGVPAPTVGDAEGLLDHLVSALAAAAEREGLVDVAYRTLDSPVGPLLLAATEAGLVRVAFAARGTDGALSELAARVSPRVLESPRRLDAVAHELEEYFTGRRHAFDVALDLQLLRGFRRTVVEHLPEIPYGRTASYAEVATVSGRPRAVRAVGTACALNPLPIVVPCHRVVRSDGTMGGYAGGPDVKRALLDLEDARLVAAG